MTPRPVLPRGTRTAAPGGRRAAGLRRVLPLLAVALTVMAGPLGRPVPDLAPTDEIFRLVGISSLSATR